jgi:hypothetical protein
MTQPATLPAIDGACAQPSDSVASMVRMRTFTFSRLQEQRVTYRMMPDAPPTHRPT